MPISKNIQVLIWLALLLFWSWFSLDYHPTLIVDIAVTFVLLSAYASAVYFNYLILLPHFLHTRGYLQYVIALLLSMCVLTFLAFNILRLIYTCFGYGAVLGDYWYHYSLDLFGMVVHVSAAMLFIWIVSLIKGRRQAQANS
jgi:hypothetical protein